MKPTKPTIKGIFVNSHIKIVKRLKGDVGLRALEAKYGHPIRFKNSADVPVREEVKIIETALRVISDRPIAPEKLAFEGGRFHFRNFTTTPLAKLIFSVFRKRFKLLMLQSRNIAGHVFEGVKFSSEELGPKMVRVVMENNDYPLAHFQGLFQEWMDYAGHSGVVEAQETAPNRFEYTMQWK